MTTVVDGTLGVDNHKAGSVVQADLAPNVAGKGPAFSARNGVTLNLSSGVDTKLALSVEEFDTASAFDSVTTYRFQPSVAGYYSLSANGYSRGMTLSAQQITIKKNGVAVVYSFTGATSETIQSTSCVTYLNGSTDYIELFGLVTAATSPRFDSASMSGFLARSAT